MRQVLSGWQKTEAKTFNLTANGSCLGTFKFSTVNSKILARVLLSGNYAYAKFREKNHSKMLKSLRRLLIKVTHALVANF